MAPEKKVDCLWCGKAGRHRCRMPAWAAGFAALGMAVAVAGDVFALPDVRWVGFAATGLFGMMAALSVLTGAGGPDGT